MTNPFAQAQSTSILVSDAERERTVEILHQGWLEGRLREDDLEDRVREAYDARDTRDLWHAVRGLPMPVPAHEPYPHAAAWSAGLSGMGVALFLLSFAFAFALTLPMSATGWILGRRVRRQGLERGASLARFGEVAGAIGTLVALMALAGCAAIVVAV